ncbi:uncharacterized protein PSFLO_04265 [Pseudozyma flocculosa]|uniref:Uncharacterized protein n=1 Tax=Pseudozyma flocculosa TaxID=84751 RepID=A0A5C3F4C1_9BASI|nr:uncharacterized protein PSFLO_04265 [Pseudozyma flocculosa]
MAATVIVVDRLPRRLPRDDGGGRENLAIGADRHARSHAGTQGGKSLIRSDEWRVQFGRLLDEPTSGLVGGRTAIDELSPGAPPRTAPHSSGEKGEGKRGWDGLPFLVPGPALEMDHHTVCSVSIAGGCAVVEMTTMGEVMAMMVVYGGLRRAAESLPKAKQRLRWSLRYARAKGDGAGRLKVEAGGYDGRKATGDKRGCRCEAFRQVGVESQSASIRRCALRLCACVSPFTPLPRSLAVGPLNAPTSPARPYDHLPAPHQPRILVLVVLLSSRPRPRRHHHHHPPLSPNYNRAASPPHGTSSSEPAHRRSAPSVRPPACLLASLPPASAYFLHRPSASSLVALLRSAGSPGSSYPSLGAIPLPIITRPANRTHGRFHLSDTPARPGAIRPNRRPPAS